MSVADGDHQPPPKATSGVPFLVIGNVSGTGKLDFADTRFVPESYYKKLDPARCPRPGDILYSVTGSFGIPVLVNTNQPFCVQRHLAIARPAPSCDQKYLYQVLGSRCVFQQAASIATGTAQKTVPLKGLRKIEVPVAPRAEQVRIAEALESYLTRLDAATEGLKRVEANLKRYRASVLKAAVEGNLVPTEAELAKKEKREFEPASVLLERILKERRHRWEQAELAKMKAKGEVPNNDKWRDKYEEAAAPDTSDLPGLPEGWCWATVDQLSLLIQYGTSAKTNEEAEGVPVIRMGNIVDGYLTLEPDTLKYLPHDHDEFPSLLLETGDMLFNRTNSAELVGKSAVYMGVPRPCSFASYLIRVRFPQGIRGAYIAAYLNSLAGKQWVASVKNQQVGQANVNGSKLAACAIPVPPEAEQERIATELEKAASNIENLASGTARDVVRAGRLRQSILRWAFEGKLVDQDPNDQPASVLLERIRGERESSQSVKTPKPERARRKTA
jgi:type I restriction enzyme S subunit